MAQLTADSHKQTVLLDESRVRKTIDDEILAQVVFTRSEVDKERDGEGRLPPRARSRHYANTVRNIDASLSAKGIERENYVTNEELRGKIERAVVQTKNPAKPQGITGNLGKVIESEAPRNPKV